MLITRRDESEARFTDSRAQAHHFRHFMSARNRRAFNGVASISGLARRPFFFSSARERGRGGGRCSTIALTIATSWRTSTSIDTGDCNAAY